MSSDSKAKVTDFKRLAGDPKQGQKRIESPLAKYNSIGQLTCIICNQVVKSELIWNAHLNSKQHLENKNKLKSQLAGGTKAQEQTTSKASNDNSAFKRPISTITPSQSETSNDLNNKKQKLDNLVKKDSKSPKVVAESDAVTPKTNDKKKENATEIIETKMDTSSSNQEQNQVQNALISSSATAIPEGFFDDPDLDDKIRGVSRAQNLEAEYEEFKKIIQSEEHKSDVIVENDDNLRDVERDLEEVDLLINRWSKIEDLHLKREAILASNKLKKAADEEKAQKMDDSDDDSDVDLENVLNLELKSKKRC